MEPIGQLTWQPDGETQEAFEELTLLGHAMMEEREHVQACGGCAECGTCRVRVLAGMENLSPLTVDERELREDFPDRFGPDERLACQCRPLGDVVVEVPTEAPPDLRLE